MLNVARVHAPCELSLSVLEQMQAFARRFGKDVSVDGTRWRYYGLGAGHPILWLTGGLRRAAFGFDFLERLAARHRVIAPDFRPYGRSASF